MVTKTKKVDLKAAFEGAYKKGFDSLNEEFKGKPQGYQVKLTFQGVGDEVSTKYGITQSFKFQRESGQETTLISKSKVFAEMVASNLEPGSKLVLEKNPEGFWIFSI